MKKLSRERRKVEQLATQARSDKCGHNHQRLNIVYLRRGESASAWPGPGAAERCTCGVTLEYVQIVNEIRQ